MKRVGRVATRTSLEIAASPLGVGFETLDRRLFEPERTYKHLAKLGVKWARCQTGWARCEQVKGVYDFNWLDEVVDSLLAIGVTPWFNLGYGNRLYTPASDAAAVGWAPIFDDEALAGWLAYVEELAHHFKGRVKHWEIWNEPNLNSFWRPGEPDPVAYTRLVAASAPLIRNIVPGAVIIGGAFSNIPLGYFDESLAAGLGRYVDKIAYHPYASIPERGYVEAVEAMHGLLRKHGVKEMALWQGENGCPSITGGSGALRDLDWNETRQAKWLLRRIVADLMVGAELTSYFLIVDLIGYRGETLGNMKGLLHGDSYEPKPSYYAYQNLCAVFDATTELSPLKGVKVGSDQADDVVCVGFKRHGKPLLAYWQATDLMQETEPQRVAVEMLPGDLAAMQPLRLLDPLDGALYEVSDLAEMPLYDYPLILGSAESL